MVVAFAVLPATAGQSQIPRSSIWSTRELSFPGPRPRPIKQAGRGKWFSRPCTLELAKSSSQPELLPFPTRSIGAVASAKAPAAPNKGWTDVGFQDNRLLSQFRALSVLASDRAEMHTILAHQRDNWNLLFHSTITIASVSAAAVAAVNAGEQALGLSVVATTLGLGAALLMALVNKVQPSQLAEEQRTAARFFKHLKADIEVTLETDCSLREEASHYWEQKVGTLHALDKGFPLPLTQVVLPKFPKTVRPSIPSAPVDLSSQQLRTSSKEFMINGWTSETETDLQRSAQLLHSSDIPTCVDIAKGVNHLNKMFTITSPLLAVVGALCCMAAPIPVGLGAVFTVGALFSHSMSHAVQLGAVFESYRNYAGYYADSETSIQKSLRVPVHQREDGMLFRQKISLLLGRNPTQFPLVESDDKTAGTLF